LNIDYDYPLSSNLSQQAKCRKGSAHELNPKAWLHLTLCPYTSPFRWSPSASNISSRPVDLAETSVTSSPDFDLSEHHKSYFPLPPSLPSSPDYLAVLVPQCYTSGKKYHTLECSRGAEWWETCPGRWPLQSAAHFPECLEKAPNYRGSGPLQRRASTTQLLGWGLLSRVLCLTHTNYLPKLLLACTITFLLSCIHHTPLQVLLQFWRLLPTLGIELTTSWLRSVPGTWPLSQRAFVVGRNVSYLYPIYMPLSVLV
jgi:hypothetical protein